MTSLLRIAVLGLDAGAGAAYATAKAEVTPQPLAEQVLPRFTAAKQRLAADPSGHP